MNNWAGRGGGRAAPDRYDRVSPGQRGQIKSGQFGHFIHLTAEWAADQLWVVDLRLEIPVEKTVLLGRSPIKAFSDDVGYAELAQRLGARIACVEQTSMQRLQLG